MQVLPYSDLIDVPWKNGGGITRNIATGMQGAQTVWRISRADVAQDGAFSNFAGLMRVLTVVSGGGMALENPQGTLSADLWKPVQFDGDLAIHSRLNDGPLTDLNLMFDPNICEGDVLTHQGPLDQIAQRPTEGIVAFHVLSGRPEIDGVALTSGDTAFLDDLDVTLKCAAGDALLEIRLRYLDQSDAIKLCMAER